MSDIFSRLAQGPNSMQPEDYENWNQMVGSAPPQQFHGAVNQALQQVNPQDYYNHIQPGAGGTNPVGTLSQPQRTGLVDSILGALTGRGVNQQTIQQAANAPSLNPSNMSPQQVASLLQWMQQNHPEALAGVASQYKNQPDLLHAILGNKALMLAVGALGLKLLNDQRQRQG